MRDDGSARPGTALPDGGRGSAGAVTPLSDSPAAGAVTPTSNGTPTEPVTPTGNGTPAGAVTAVAGGPGAGAPPSRRKVRVPGGPVPGPELPGLLPAMLLDGSEPGRRSGRDYAVDITCVLLSLGFGGLLFAAAPEHSTAPHWLLMADAAAGLPCCVAVWWRRRWPLQLAVVTAVLSTFSAMVAIASVIALFTVALHRPARTLVWVTALNLAASLAYIVVRPDPTTEYWVAGLIAVLVLAATVAWGLFTRARRQLVQSLRDRAERAEAEQQLRVGQARQLERARIAREMHDVLAHRISLVSLHAGALEFRARTVGDDVARSAAVIRDAAHQALEDLREVIGVLRADVGDDENRPQPSLGDLARLVEESRAAGMRVTASVTVDHEDALPLSTGRTAYRIVQEGLTNARKHAPGAAVAVSLNGGPGGGLDVEVLSRRSITATGIPGAGSGLVGLSERAGLAGGRLEHGHTPDGGFRLHAWLPWPA
jgi:signal transduction histidine kinase